MRPFDFVITFFSFIFSLALAHLLLAVGHMIRRRREIAIDWAHSSWMVAALGTLVANWLSLWDFHTFGALSLATIALGFIFCINQYLVCALVAPRVGGDDGLDMRAFHEQQGRTYIGALAFLFAFSITVNLLAGSALDVGNWARQNGIVVAMFLVCLPPLAWRARWVQIASPVVLGLLEAAFLVSFYPVLR